MSGPDEKKAALRRLAVEVRADLKAIDRVGERIAEVADMLHPGVEPDKRDKVYLAHYLHHFYTGAEQLMNRVARAIDGTDYSGSAWHRDLLRDMAMEVPDLRPAFLSEATRDLLDDYRGFRHVVRHAYDREYDWERMKVLVERFKGVLARFKTEANAFLDFINEAVRCLEEKENGPAHSPSGMT